jgi:hypothetical protein
MKYLYMFSIIIIKKAIICLRDFKEFDFLMESHYVACELGSEFLNML